MLPLADIHIHILPGVDDGAPDWSVSERMVSMAYADGIRMMILTPHHRGNMFQKSPEELNQVFAEFSNRFSERYKDMSCFLGCESYYEIDLSVKLSNGTVLPMAQSQYVLLEFSPNVEYSKIFKAVNTMIQYNYFPILAHIERYRCLRGKLDRIKELQSQGAYFQLNADSVIGKNGFLVQRFCTEVIRQGIADFIASDAHRADRRRPLLYECSCYVAKRFGAECERMLFWKNAQAIAENKRI